MSTVDELSDRERSASDLRAWRYTFNRGIILSTVPSFFVGVLTVAFSTELPQWVHYPAQLIAGAVRSIEGIARSSQQPSTVVLIMGWQWAFLPLYVGIWFSRLAPWSHGVRDRIEVRLRVIDKRTRRVMVLGCLFMAVYVLADIGLIPHFPTLFNAKWAYPPSHAALWLRPIYHSDFLLMIYAWFSPIAEVCIWWTLIAYFPHLHKLLGSAQ
jgi:hypothetical protein